MGPSRGLQMRRRRRIDHCHLASSVEYEVVRTEAIYLDRNNSEGAFALHQPHSYTGDTSGAVRRCGESCNEYARLTKRKRRTI